MLAMLMIVARSEMASSKIEAWRRTLAGIFVSRQASSSPAGAAQILLGNIIISGCRDKFK